jgi:hypothetical protein
MLKDGCYFALLKKPLLYVLSKKNLEIYWSWTGRSESDISYGKGIDV